MKKPLTIQDYRPAPFWFMNHKLEEDELVRQLRLMKEQHVESFFIHPRAGLQIPYGGARWFELVRFIVDEAEKLGMTAWLYDEDPFPSGAAGGRILMDHPEYAARGLKFHEYTVAADGHISCGFGSGKLLEAWLVTEPGGGAPPVMENIFNQVGVLRTDFFQCRWPSSYYAQIIGRVPYNHYRAETFFPKLALDDAFPPGARIWAVTAETIQSEEKYGRLIDNLNPDAVREFIRLTHDQYAFYLGDRLGRSVKGIFTDETAAGGWEATIWTEGLDAFFRNRHGYGLTGNYYKLFRAVDESCRDFREAYWDSVSALFIESFYRPVNTWCGKHRIELTGHGVGEENPLATGNGGNIYALQNHVGIPGFDHITCNIPNGKDFYSLNLGGKLVASAAAQNGQHQVQSECMGCNPYNFSPAGMFKNCHWLFALGVNWLVPHGFHYSYDGFRKDDAGKSFFFQDPYFPDFHRFSDYFARLGFKLGEARSAAQVAVLYPVSSFLRLIPAEREAAEALREEMYCAIRKLMERHIQFELVDEKTLFSVARVEDGGGIQVKAQSYRRLYLPFTAITESTRRKLAALQRRGVSIVEPDAIDSLAGENDFTLNITGGAAERSLLMPLRKNAPDGTALLYFFNNQDSIGIAELTLAAPAITAIYRYCPHEDSRQAISRDADGVFRIGVANYGALLLMWGTECLAGALPCPEPLAATANHFDYEQNLEWDYHPPVTGIAAALFEWDFSVGGQSLGKHRYSLFRDRLGTGLDYLHSQLACPIFDRAPRIQSPYPAGVALSCRFHLDNPECELLAESETFAGEFQLEVNGRPVDAARFRRCRIYDPYNIALDISAELQSGDNRIVIRWNTAGEFDGLRSALYLLEKKHMGN